jgi:hypothetical protein
MNTHRNTKFKRFGLSDTMVADGKRMNAYVKAPNGMLIRRFEKTTKKWINEHGR